MLNNNQTNYIISSAPCLWLQLTEGAGAADAEDAPAAAGLLCIIHTHYNQHHHKFSKCRIPWQESKKEVILASSFPYKAMR